MSLQTPLSLAKISKPKLTQVLPRQRLIDRLSTVDNALIWIGGAPGYGKTTLAASFAEQLALPCLWLNIDAADIDPANFFLHLSEAAKPLLRADTGLPILTMEQLGSVEAYARQYFRVLFQEMSQGFILVLDDMHRLPSDCTVVKLLPILLEETIESARLVITSRQGPPLSLIRYRANGRVYVMGPEELLFTETETSQLFKLWQQKTAKLLAPELHKLTRGWAAGMALIRADIENNPTSAGINLSSAPSMQDYFRSEIFEYLPKEDQLRLSRLAWLGVITAESCDLLADSTTFDLIIRMSQMAQFVFEHSGESRAYCFHPLFADFLREVASKDTALAAQKIKRQTAQALVATGDLEAAIDLWLDCSAFDLAVPCIEDIARTLFTQARLHTLIGWIEVVPEASRSPWLTYWWALCRWLSDPVAACERMVIAYQRFKADGNTQGMYLALSYLISSYFFSSSGADDLQNWLHEFELLEVDFDQIIDRDMQASIAFSVWYGLFMTRPEHKDLPVWESRMQRLLRADIDPTAKIRIGMILSLHYCFTGQYGKVWPLRVLLSVELNNTRLSNFGHLAWYLYSLQDHWSRGDFSSARTELGEALALSDQCGCHLLDHHIILHGVSSFLLDSALDEADSWLQQVSHSAHTARDMEVWHLYLLKAWCACLCGNQVEAAEYAGISWQAARDMGSVAPQFFALAARCYSHLLNNDIPETEACLFELRQHALSTDNELTAFHIGLIQAYLALSKGNDGNAQAPLAKAFAIGRRQGLFHFILAIPDILLALCRSALESDIETEFAIELVKQRRLFSQQVPLYLEQWPWPVKIYTLGSFAVSLDGQPMARTSKAQRRTLELLKVIIAMGGHNVSVSMLCDVLWPDAEGDAAHHALESSLYRLRKIVGKDTLVLHDAKVSLAPERCWVDIWAVDSILKESSSRHVRAEKIRAIYRGPFLADEPDASWAMDRRNRLHRQVQRFLCDA